MRKLNLNDRRILFGMLIIALAMTKSWSTTASTVTGHSNWASADVVQPEGHRAIRTRVAGRPSATAAEAAAAAAQASGHTPSAHTPAAHEQQRPPAKPEQQAQQPGDTNDPLLGGNQVPADLLTSSTAGTEAGNADVNGKNWLFSAADIEAGTPVMRNTFDANMNITQIPEPTYVANVTAYPCGTTDCQQSKNFKVVLDIDQAAINYLRSHPNDPHIQQYRANLMANMQAKARRLAIAKAKAMAKQKQQQALCEKDDSGADYDYQGKIDCLARNAMNKKDDKARLAAIKKIVNDQIVDNLTSTDPDKRSEAIAAIESLETASSDVTGADKYLTHLVSFSEDYDRLMKIAQEDAANPNNAVLLEQNKMEIDRIAAKWNRTNYICSMPGFASTGRGCSEAMSSDVSAYQSSILKMAQMAETGHGNPYLPDNGNSPLGITGGGRGQRVNVGSMNSNFGRTGWNGGNSWNNGSNWNNNNWGNTNSGFGNNSIFNQNRFGVNNNGGWSPTANSNLGGWHPNINSQTRFSTFGSSATPFTTSTFGTQTPWSPTGNTFSSAHTASRFQASPSLSTAAPFSCQQLGPGYCVHGIGS